MSEKNRIRPLPPRHGRAICYSGYREGQSPDLQIFPTYEQIREDLRILESKWDFLRIYDSGPHAQTTLEVIAKEGMNFQLMLGMASAAEKNNPKCPWGADYSEEQLAANREENLDECNRAIQLANQYRDIVFSVSIGNEATVEWTDHLIPSASLVGFVNKLHASIEQPVTFCENYVPWVEKLTALGKAVDFLSVHTYPVWEYKHIDEALEYSKQNIAAVQERWPNKPIVITEAGWTTASNGRGIEPTNASPRLQARYVRDLLDWTDEQGILCFVFEAFDEPWKGSDDPLEPEKHWGLYRVNRKPKLVMGI